MRKGEIDERRVTQLVQVLGELKHLHDDLCAVVKRKLDAIRSADTDAMRSAYSREDFLAQRIRERDGFRKQIVELIVTPLGTPADRARALTISELAALVREPARSQLLGLAAALRARVQELAETNRVAAMVSAEMLKHFRHVYEMMASSHLPPLTYSRTGGVQARHDANVFEAVG